MDFWPTENINEGGREKEKREAYLDAQARTFKVAAVPRTRGVDIERARTKEKEDQHFVISVLCVTGAAKLDKGITERVDRGIVECWCFV